METTAVTDLAMPPSQLSSAQPLVTEQVVSGRATEKSGGVTEKSENPCAAIRTNADGSTADGTTPVGSTANPVCRCVWMILVAIAGIATIIVGIILLPLPGPGSLVIFAGIGILATEFPWARKLFNRIRYWARQVILRVRIWSKQFWARRHARKVGSK